MLGYVLLIPTWGAHKLICAVRTQVANAQAAEPQQAEAMGAGAGGGGGASHGPPPPPGDGIDQDLQARLNNLRKT